MPVEVAMALAINEHDFRLDVVDERLETPKEVFAILAVAKDAIGAHDNGRTVSNAHESRWLRKQLIRVGALVGPARQGPNAQPVALPMTRDEATAVEVGDLCRERHVSEERAIDLCHHGKTPQLLDAHVWIDEDICELVVLLEEDAHLVIGGVTRRLGVRGHSRRDYNLRGRLDDGNLQGSAKQRASSEFGIATVVEGCLASVLFGHTKHLSFEVEGKERGHAA